MLQILSFSVPGEIQFPQFLNADSMTVTLSWSAPLIVGLLNYEIVAVALNFNSTIVSAKVVRWHV